MSRLPGFALPLAAVALTMVAFPAMAEAPAPPVAPSFQLPVALPIVVASPAAPALVSDAADLHEMRVLLIRRLSHEAHMLKIAKSKVKAQAVSCTSGNWRSTMTSAEVWIDSRESALDPRAVNSWSGAHGLGQLEAAEWTSDPCAQLRDQRAYIAGRYQTEAAAMEFWQSHGWY